MANKADLVRNRQVKAAGRELVHLRTEAEAEEKNLHYATSREPADISYDS